MGHLRGSLGGTICACSGGWKALFHRGQAVAGLGSLPEDLAGYGLSATSKQSKQACVQNRASRCKSTERENKKVS